MSRSIARRGVRALVASITATLIVVPMVSASASAGPSSHRMASTPAVSIRLDEFSPSAPLAGDTLTIGGSITTLASDGTGALSVRLRVLSPVTGRFDLPMALNPNGARASRNVRSQVVAPGSNRGDVIPFSLSVPVAALHLSTPGVYPIAVDAISGTRDLGSTRTLLPWFPSGTTLTRLGVTLVWPISGIPDENAIGQLATDSLPKSMSSGGRLDVLSSTAASVAGVSPVVDPFLLQFAHDNPDSYTVLTASGQTTTVNNQTAMTEWLAKTQSAMDSNPSALTSYANVDASALLDASQNPLVLQAVHLSNIVSAQIFAAPNTRPRVFVPQSGWVTPAQALQLAHDGVSAVVVSSASVPTVRQLDYTSSGRADYTTSRGIARYVLADASLSDAVTRSSTANPVTLRQRLLGESLLIALELPSVHRTIAVAPFGMWTPSADVANAVVAGLINTRWTTPVALPDLIATAPPSVNHRFLPMPAAIRAQQLSAGQVRSVVAATSPLTDVKAVTNALDPYRVTMEQGQFRAASQTWRTMAAAGREFAQTYATDVQAARDSLTVRVPRTIVIPGESGVLPVTVVNDLPASVAVKVLVQATPSFRIKVKDPGVIAVDPKKRHSLEVPITVYGSGSLDLTIRLTSADGRVVTDPLVVTVRSSAYSRVAAIVAGIAFLALLGLSIASITRRIRNRGKDDS